MKAQRERQTAFEAEKAKYTDDVNQRLQKLEETHRNEATELRKESESSSREAKSAAAMAASTVAQSLEEREEAVRKARNSADAAEKKAGVKITALEEETESLRLRLKSVPAELRAEYEREFDERERRVRDEVRGEVSGGCWGRARRIASSVLLRKAMISFIRPECLPRAC